VLICFANYVILVMGVLNREASMSERGKDVDPIKLSLLCSIAEEVVKRLVEDDCLARGIFSSAFNCPGHFTLLTKQKVANFNSEHAIDLCIVKESGVVFPIEVKAGLTVPQIKTNTRMFGKGNMLAILGTHSEVSVKTVGCLVVHRDSV